jgi:hypothetical protein
MEWLDKQTKRLTRMDKQREGQIQTHTHTQTDRQKYDQTHRHRCANTWTNTQTN